MLKKRNSYKQTETKWQKRGKMKTKKTKQKKNRNSVLGSLLNDFSQSDKFSEIIIEFGFRII